MHYRLALSVYLSSILIALATLAIGISLYLYVNKAYVGYNEELHVYSRCRGLVFVDIYGTNYDLYIVLYNSDIVVCCIKGLVLYNRTLINTSLIECVENCNYIINRSGYICIEPRKLVVFVVHNVTAYDFKGFIDCYNHVIRVRDRYVYSS